MRVTNDDKGEQVRVIMAKLYDSLCYAAPETWPAHISNATASLVSVAIHLPADHLTLDRHAEIVRSIYREQAHEHKLISVILGRPGQHGHRFYGERCVWCGVNYFDDLLDPSASDENPCGPKDGEWSNQFWPYEKVDSLLLAERSRDRKMAD